MSLTAKGILSREREDDLKFKEDLNRVENGYKMLSNIESKLKSYLSGSNIDEWEMETTHQFNRQRPPLLPENDTMKTLTNIAEEIPMDEEIGETAEFDGLEMDSHENLRNLNLEPNKESIITVYKSKENLSNGPRFDLGRELTFKKDPQNQSSRGVGRKDEVIDSRIRLLDEKINRYKQENQEIARELNNENDEEEEDINEQEFRELIGGDNNRVRINPISKTEYNKSNPHYFSNTTIASKINKNAVSNPETGLRDVKVDMTEIEASRIIDQLEASNLAELSYNYEMEKQRMMEMIKTQKKIISEMEQKIVKQDNPAFNQNAPRGPYNFDYGSRPTYQTPVQQQLGQAHIMRSIPVTPIPKMGGNNYFRGADQCAYLTDNGDGCNLAEAQNNFLANSEVNTSIKKQFRPRSSNTSHRNTNPYIRARSTNISFSHMNNAQSGQAIAHDATSIGNPLFEDIYRKKKEWSRIREKSLNTGWNTPSLAHVPSLPLNPTEEYMNPVDRLIKSSRLNHAKKRSTFKKAKRRKTKRMKSRKSRLRRGSKSREKRLSRSRVAGKSIDALNYFVKGVRDLVESHSEYYNFEPTCRAKSIRKKKNAIKLIYKTLKGEKLGKNLKKAVETKRSLKSEKLCEKIKRKKKKKRTKKKKHFDVIAALNRIGGFDN